MFARQRSTRQLERIRNADDLRGKGLKLDIAYERQLLRAADIQQDADGTDYRDKRQFKTISKCHVNFISLRGGTANSS